jgi:hypothetical protein
MDWGSTYRNGRKAGGRRFSRALGTAMLLAAVCHSQPVSAQQKSELPDQKTRDSIARKALGKVPHYIDTSPLPNYRGDFVSLGADGVWHRPAGAAPFLQSQALGEGASADCSEQAIIDTAKAAPYAFEADKKGLLYGIETHTPETRVTTRYWDMPGFNSCALVVYAILKKAGCKWARYTANAKAVYDMAYEAGWRPATEQRGGCMVAWNSKWQGTRQRIGDRQKQGRSGSTRFRHVGITTGAWLSVDNSSWMSRPTTFFTIRPVTYERPIFLCPPADAPANDAEAQRRR